MYKLKEQDKKIGTKEKHFWVVSRPGPQTSTSRALTWIQCKLGKQYLVKKCTLPWESNPGPTPVRGDPATLIASVGLKKNPFPTVQWANGAMGPWCSL